MVLTHHIVLYWKLSAGLRHTEFLQNTVIFKKPPWGLPQQRGGKLQQEIYMRNCGCRLGVEAARQIYDLGTPDIVQAVYHGGMPAMPSPPL